MMFEILVGIVVMLGTIVGVAGSILLGGKWLVRSIVTTELAGFADKKLEPLNTTLGSLDKTAALLTQSIEESKAIQVRDHHELQQRDREMHRAVISLESLVKEHDKTLNAHTTAIAELQRIQRRSAE